MEKKRRRQQRERQVSNEIAQEVVVGIKKKASAPETANLTKDSWAKCETKLGLLTKWKT